MVFEMKVEWIEKRNIFKIWIGKGELRNVGIMILLNVMVECE